MNRIDRDGAARWAEEARRRAEELARARSQTPPGPSPAPPTPAPAARPASEDVLERAPRLFGREIVLDGPAPPTRIDSPDAPVADTPPPSTPGVPSGPRTDVLPRLTPPPTPRARLDADFDRQQLIEALGGAARSAVATVPVAPIAAEVAAAPAALVEVARALVAVKRVAWDEAAPALLGTKLKALAEKAGTIESRANQVKEALSAVNTRNARTVVGFRMAGGLLEKAAYKAAIARELSKLVPRSPEGSRERMVAARQQLLDVQGHAGEAEAMLHSLAANATQTPWALREVGELQRTAGTAQWELSQTASRGEMLAGMDAGAGWLAEAPAPEAPATPAAAGTTPGAEFEFGREDLERLGSGLDPSKPPAQTNWSEQMVNTVCELGRQQGGVTDEQGGRNFELAKVVLGSSEGSTGAKPLEAVDLAAVLKMAGVDLAKVDPNQLQSAARYVSGATSLEDQQQKLRKAIDNFQVLEKIGLPKLSRQQMMDQLWGVAKVPGHALAKLSDSELQKKFQEVLGAVNAGPGKSEIKIGKYNLKLEVGQNGTVSKSSCKKPGFLSKVWGAVKKIAPIALTVASFIPVTAPFARAAQEVISLVQAIKAKSVLGIAAAGASLFGGASRLAQMASRGLQGVSQIKSGNWMGGLASIGSVVGSGLKGLSGALGKVADRLDQVSGKLSAVGAGVASFEAYKKADKAVKEAKEGLRAAQASGDARAIAAAQKQLEQAETQKRAALIGGVAGAATAASALAGSRSLFRGQSGSVRPAQTALERNLQFASRALGVAQGVAGKDYAGAAVSAFSLGATVNSAKKGGSENRLNQAANMAQAGLSYYQAEKGRKAANQAVSEAQKRLDAARRSANPELLRQAEADLRKAKGAAESALMNGMAASESLLATARDIGDQYRKEKAERPEKARQALKAANERTTAGRKIAEGLGALANDPRVSRESQEGARAEQAKVQAAEKDFQKAVAEAKGDPDKIARAVDAFAKVQTAAVSRVVDFIQTASAGPDRSAPSSASSEAASPGLASMRRPQKIGSAKVTKGLTVWEVSQRTGVPVERILEFNAQSGNALNTKNLQIGQQILVPLDEEDIKFKPLSAEQVRDLKQKANAEMKAKEQITVPALRSSDQPLGPPEDLPLRFSETIDVSAGLTKAQAADGFILGAGGKQYPRGTTVSELRGVLPEGRESGTHLIIFNNGIDTRIDTAYEHMDAIAKASGAEVIGVYNATEGKLSDIFQSLKDKLGVGNNRATQTTADLVYQLLTMTHASINLMGHSQGALINSDALFEVAQRLRRDGLSQAFVERLMGRVHLDTFGGAAWTYPNGVQARHYVNDRDPVPDLFGQVAPYLSFPLWMITRPGREAETIHFSSGEGNLHDFEKVYLPHWKPSFPLELPPRDPPK